METVYRRRTILRCRRDGWRVNSPRWAYKPFNGAIWSRLFHRVRPSRNPRHQREMLMYRASEPQHYHAIMCYLATIDKTNLRLHRLVFHLARA